MELKDYDWSREGSIEDDHEVIFLQPDSDERTWCQDSIDPDLTTDTAYVRADKLRDVLALLRRRVVVARRATDHRRPGHRSNAADALEAAIAEIEDDIL